MNKKKVAFIGCGDHANRFIYPSLANVEEAILTAVCSLDTDKAEVNRRRHGAESAYTDYREMIEKESPDAVLIVGPPKLHYEAGKFCLEHDLPFFIEKPPGENLEQATELVKLEQNSKGFGQIGFMMRHSKIIKKVCETAEKADLGKMRYGTVKYYTSGPYRSDEIYGLPGTDDASFLWRYLMVQAVHPVNLGASFIGDIVDIRSDVIFSDENILVEIKLRDDKDRRMTVVLHTFVAPGFGNLKLQTELNYEHRGMIFTDNFDELRFYPPQPTYPFLETSDGNAVHWRAAPFGNNNEKMGYETEIREFINHVGTDMRPTTSLSDGLKTMRILTETATMRTGEKQ